MPYLLGNQRCERCVATAENEELLAKEISKKEVKDKENGGSNKNGKDKDSKSKPKNVNQRLKVCQLVLSFWAFGIPRDIYEYFFLSSVI